MSLYISAPAGACLRLVCALVCVGLHGTAIYAEPLTTLSNVTVTGSLREQPIEDVLGSVQSITRHELEAYSGASVLESLKMATGVDARTSGSIGIRGFALQSGAFLINGLRRPGKYGGFSANLVELANVERIEVVRGPMSALYGADATGGAINVITSSPVDDTETKGYLSATGGATLDPVQRKTALTSAGVQFGTGVLRHRLNLEARHRSRFKYDRSEDQYDLRTTNHHFLSYEGGARVATDHTVRWSYEYTHQHDYAPSYTSGRTREPFQAYEKERRHFASLHHHQQLNAGFWSTDVAYAQDNAATTRSYPNIECTRYQQVQLHTKAGYEFNQHFLVGGAGYTRDHIDVSINPAVATRKNVFVYLQDEWRFAPTWTVLAGLRYDHFSDFSGVVMPRVTLQKRLDVWRWRIGYGQAYQAPSVLQQYASFTRGRFLIAGNPDLKAERNQAWETALGYYGDELEAEWVLFRSDARDKIATQTQPRLPSDPATILSRSVYRNIDQARHQGSELSVSWQYTPTWRVQLGWDYLDATDRNTRQRLTGHARHMVRAAIHWEQGAWRADVQHRHYLDYYASDPTIRNGQPYNTRFGTTDAKLRYQLNTATQLYVGVDNVFNQVQPINFRAMGVSFDPPKRFVYAGARYEF